MSILPNIFAYLAVAIFGIAVVVRFVFWSRLPMHVRWEFYPVAHEKGRAHYGGSYLEETDWWKKKREVSLLGELKVMVPEILFLVALKEHNPKLWLRSFPFHMGLYLAGGCFGLMVALGLASVAAPSILVGGLGDATRWVVAGLAYGGLVLGLLGALGLLQRRTTDPALKSMTAPADIFNLLFFVLAFGVSLAHVALVDPTLGRSIVFVADLVAFKQTAWAGSTVDVALGWSSVILLAALVAYIPLTHMSHFVGKYFAYHAIRWNDTPNLKGGDQEAAIGELLNQPVSWSAPHIKGDGKKTWGQLATEKPE